MFSLISLFKSGLSSFFKSVNTLTFNFSLLESLLLSFFIWSFIEESFSSSPLNVLGFESIRKYIEIYFFLSSFVTEEKILSLKVFIFTGPLKILFSIIGILHLNSSPPSFKKFSEEIVSDG